MQNIGPITPLGIALEVGQLWKEVDPRFERVVKVAGWLADEGKVKLGSGGRYTYAKISRFNGKRTGYALFTKEEKP